MGKQISELFQKVSKIFIKLFVLFVMFGLMLIDWMIVYTVPQHILYIYGFVMFVCLVSFGLTMFSKIRKISYIIFFLSLIIYICMYNFVPDIKADACGIRGGRLKKSLHKSCPTHHTKYK